MAGKRPASLFYWGDWRRDPDLSRCSKAAKGVWMDMLSVAFECEQPGIFATVGAAWTIEEIARAIGGDVPENSALIQELLTKGVARRTPAGAIFCRRMVQDDEAYKQDKAATRDRVQRYREKHRGEESSDVTGNVTPDVTEKKRPCTETETVTVTEVAFKVLSTKELKDLIDRVFAFYCHTFRRNPKQYSLTEKRRRKAELRLLERLKVHSGDVETVEIEAQQAFKNLAASDFHQSQGFIDWEDQFFRSDEEYEKRLNMKPRPQQQGNKPNGKSNAEQRVERNREKYARIEQRITGVPADTGTGLSLGIGRSGNSHVAGEPELLSPGGDPAGGGRHGVKPS